MCRHVRTLQRFEYISCLQSWLFDSYQMPLKFLGETPLYFLGVTCVFCFFFSFFLYPVLSLISQAFPACLTSNFRGAVPAASTRGQHDRTPSGKVSGLSFQLAGARGTCENKAHYYWRQKPPATEHCREFKYTIREVLRVLGTGLQGEPETLITCN